MKVILLVGLGGAMGSILRYATTLIAEKWHVSNAFIATIIANLIGCLLIGIFISSFENKGIIDNNLKLLLITGFCGGYTTFSTFSLENIQLIQSGQIAQAVLYILTSVLIGIVAVWAGLSLGKSI